MAINLVGQTVNINWHAPIVSSHLGQVYLRGGVISFDIRPDLPPDEIYEVALHECSHYLAGHELPNRDEIPYYAEFEKLFLCRGPLLDLSPQEQEVYKQKPKELEAAALVRELDRIARNRSFDLFSNADIENRILILSQVEILR
jgi:hypothetical protein